MKTEFNSLIQLVTAIPDEQAAIDHFTAIRWKNGAFCPYCGSTKVYHFSDAKTHKCGDCSQRFSIKVGTIFEGTKVPMRKWLMAIWLITSHKKGIASTTLAKDLKVTQKTAWFMLHRLREAARTKSFNTPLSGVVEADETFVGGKEKNKHASKRTGKAQGGAGKAVVMGMIERGGDVRAFHLKHGVAGYIPFMVSHHVAKGSCRKERWPILAAVGAGNWCWPGYQGMLSPSLAISSGDGQIIGAIFIVGAAIVWFLPSQAHD